MSYYVAVYGSLRKGMGNHRLLESNDSVFVKDIEVSGYTMVSLGGFPALIPTGVHSPGPIKAEVYQVDGAGFSALDMLEGYPNFYDRCLIDSEGEPTWIYFIDDEELLSRPVVEDGDWVAYKSTEVY